MSYIGSASSLLSPLGINLEQQALGMFGDFVDNTNKIDAFRNLGLSAADAQGLANIAKPGVFNVSSPAVANAQIAPKQRFLFQVEFMLHPVVLAELSKILSPDVLQKFGFFVKQIDRPKVDYTYEDVNMYNYRTRVLTKIVHQTLNMSLWDDARNTVSAFLNLYRMAHTPAARQETMNAGNVEELGFAFSKGITAGNVRDFSSRGTLPGNAKCFLDKIIVKQIYSTHSTRQSSPFSMTEYTFFNPVIKTFDFDEIMFDSNDFNGVTMAFDYDNLYIDDFEVASITPYADLPDYYVFNKGKRLNNSLLTLGGRGLAGDNKPGFDLLSEAKRALLTGNPLSYVKERAAGILRNGDPSLDFKGIRGYVSDATSFVTGGVSKVVSSLVPDTMYATKLDPATGAVSKVPITADNQTDYIDP